MLVFAADGVVEGEADLHEPVEEGKSPTSISACGPWERSVAPGIPTSLIKAAIWASRTLEH
ncbi:hypothetical protein ACIPY6_43035 [Streptomyces sp. NPDC090054]|uniref:hypothetical protein n=1 Tax=Streptomyces sp. NPDC090054 TaxID=3365933 RepID=UPI003809B303